MISSHKILSPNFSPDKEDTSELSPQFRPGFPAQKSGEVLYLDQYRGTAFKHWFATAFASYLRDRFVNPEQVATAFGVRASTAWNWWNGDNKASGDAVARLFMTFPDAGAWFLKSWEGRR